MLFLTDMHIRETIQYLLFYGVATVSHNLMVFACLSTCLIFGAISKNSVGFLTNETQIV